MKKLKNRFTKLKRKYLKRKLLVVFRKAFTSKGEGLAKKNCII